MPNQADEIKQLREKLNQARITHGVAVKNFDGFMESIEANYGITTLEEAAKRIKELGDQVLSLSNERDALLAQAHGILEKTPMEDSNGNTTQLRQRNPSTVGTTGRNAVVGRSRASRTPRTRK